MNRDEILSIEEKVIKLDSIVKKLSYTIEEIEFIAEDDSGENLQERNILALALLKKIRTVSSIGLDYLQQLKKWNKDAQDEVSEHLSEMHGLEETLEGSNDRTDRINQINEVLNKLDDVALNDCLIFALHELKKIEE